MKAFTRYRRWSAGLAVGISGKLLCCKFLIAFTTLSSATAFGWDYKEAAKGLEGTKLKVLDERTPLQENLQKLIPEFEKLTGITIDYELINHFEVITKFHNSLEEKKGSIDIGMVHASQGGWLFENQYLEPLDTYINDNKLTDPKFKSANFIQPAWDYAAKFNNQIFGFLTWAYSQVYIGRNDLFEHPEEQKNFKEKYGYALAAPTNFKQMHDIAEFFTRKKGATLAGKVLKRPFYGIVFEGIPGGTASIDFIFNYAKNWGGGILKDGKPDLNSPENIAALQYWSSLWKFAPPKVSEFSLIEVPNAMGNGIAAQAIAWSDYMLSIDKEGQSRFAGKFVYAPIPTVKGKSQQSALSQPSYLAINKHSKAKKASYLFLQWVSDRTTQAKLLEISEGRHIPVHPDQFASVKGPTKGLLLATKNSAEKTQLFSNIKGFSKMMDIIAKAIHEVGLGQKPADQALAAAQEEILKNICSHCLVDSSRVGKTSH